MKKLKKISLVYTLQVFAVMLLFFYTDSSSENQANKAVPGVGLPLIMDKTELFGPYKDSSLTGKISALWRTHTNKSR